MTHTPEQIKFMLDDMKKNNYHVYKLLTELLEENKILETKVLNQALRISLWAVYSNE